MRSLSKLRVEWARACRGTLPPCILFAKLTLHLAVLHFDGKHSERKKAEALSISEQTVDKRSQH